MRFSPKLLAAVFAVACIAAWLIHFHSGSDVRSSKAAAPGPKIQWQISTGSKLLTGIALGSEGTIYVGSDDSLCAISSDGKLLWKHAVFSGMGAAPVVGSNGTIYLTSSVGDVQSVNADGSSRWDSHYGLIGFDSPPVLSNEVLYLANTVSDIWAFKADSSDPKLWTVQTEREGVGFAGLTLPGTARLNQTRSAAAPLVGLDGNLYIPRQKWLHSLSPDGAERWTIPLSKGLLGAAAIGQDGTIYLGNQASDTKVYAVSSGGGERWEVAVSGIVRGSPVIDASGDIYFSLDTRLVALSPDGSMKWELEQPDSSGPALAQDGTLYLGFETYHFGAVTSDGTLKWNYKTPGVVSAAPVIGPEGTIYIATDQGEVLALRDSGSPLMNSPWPRYQHDSQNSGRAASF
jgi:outer membrane protein assembly factor BamB